MACRQHEKMLDIMTTREMQIKPTVRYRFTPAKMAKIKKTDKKCWLAHEPWSWAQGEAKVSETRPQSCNFSAAGGNFSQNCVLAPNSTLKLAWASCPLALAVIPDPHLLSLCLYYSFVLKSLCT